MSKPVLLYPEESKCWQKSYWPPVAPLPRRLFEHSLGFGVLGGFRLFLTFGGFGSKVFDLNDTPFLSRCSPFFRRGLPF